jgi:hypothetical protein
MRRAVDALLFVAISRTLRNSVRNRNRSWAPPTSDAFELFFQGFDPQDDHIVLTAGSSTHCWGKGEISFPKPLSVGGSLWDLDEELIEAFRRCLSKGPGESRERVFRSLEWFRLAHTEQSQSSLFSKVVMMGTAFEILLDFPERGKTRHFVDTVHRTLDFEHFRKGTRITPQGRKFQRNLAAVWAGKFYDLRSKIVHGDRVSVGQLRYSNRNLDEEMKWLTHLIVADVVFYDLLIHLLYNNEYLGDRAREMVQDFPGEPAGDIHELEEACFRFQYGAERVHRSLGWLKQRSSQ